MTLYLLIYSLLAFLSISDYYVVRKQRIWLLLIGTIVVIFFQGLRWRTGTDWEQYYNEFVNVNRPGWDDNFESGYKLLNSIIRTYTDKFTIFLLVECGLNAIFIILFIRSMPIGNPNLAYLYFFSFAIFPIRYTLASSIILYSYKYILAKDFRKFLLLVLLAFSIHRMVIVFLPLYFIANKNYSFKILFCIYIATIVLGYATELVFGNLIRAGAMIYGGVSDNVQGKMQSYLTEDVPEYAKMSMFRVLLSVLNSTFFILLFYYFKRKYFARDKIYNMLFNLYVLGISFNRLVFQTIPDLARLTSLFSGGFIIMTLMIMSKYHRDKQVLITCFLIFYFFITYYSSINGFYKDLMIPYYSVFSDKIRINI